MGVRRRLLRELLSSLKYIKNLTEQQIRASLWRGEATLSDLELDPERLQRLFYDTIPCGLEILKASVKEVCVRIPWRQIMTQSVIVVAHGVEVQVAVHCEDEASWREVIAKLQRGFLRSQKARIDRGPFSMLSTGAFEYMRQRMMDGVQLQVSTATMTVFSKHPRHHPCHGHLPLRDDATFGEVFRVYGEDIIMSPSDIHRVPCDKLKQMTTYLPEEGLLQVTKIIKCRAFRVSPGNHLPRCEHASNQFMDTTQPVTCYVTQRYPSDGSSICPFLVASIMHFDFPSGLDIRVCECQFRAVMAAAMDVSKLEEWRISESLLLCGSSPNNDKSCDKEPLQNTSSIARTFARGEDGTRERSLCAGSALARPGCDVSTCSAPAIGASQTGRLDSSGDSVGVSCCSGNVPDAAVSHKGAIEECTGVLQSAAHPVDECMDGAGCNRQHEPHKKMEDGGGDEHVPGVGVKDGRDDEQNELCARQPNDLVQPSTTGPLQFMEAGRGSDSDGIFEALLDTTSTARTLARGQDPKGLSHSMASDWWKRIKKSTLPSTSYFRDATNTASAADESNLVLQEAAQPLTSPAQFQERVVATSDVAIAPAESTAPNVNAVDEVGVEARCCDLETDSMVSAAEEAEPGDGEVVVEEDEGADEEEEDFYDPEDYFSVVSSNSDVTELESASLQSRRWFQPVLKWFGPKGSPSPVSMLPEMKTNRKEMVINFPVFALHMTVMEPDDSDGTVSDVVAGYAHFHVEGGKWASENWYGLPAAHLDCIRRLVYPSEDHPAPQRASLIEVGPSCLPVLLSGSQRMDFPWMDLRLAGGTAGEVHMMRGRHKDTGIGPEAAASSGTHVNEVGGDIGNAPLPGLFRNCSPGNTMSVNPSSTAGVMLGMSSLPRSSPAELVEAANSSGVLRTLRSWPMHVNLQKVHFFLDEFAWTVIKRCHERCKPFLLSKLPLPTLIPPEEPGGCAQLYPTEFMAIEFHDCEMVEPYNAAKVREERRWPVRVVVPHMSLQSYSDLWNLKRLVPGKEPDAAPDDGDRAAIGTPGGSSDRDVTLPKEMFDQLVKRAAEANIADLSEQLEKAKRRCAHLESSLHSQGLAQRRLETEFMNFQVRTQEELRRLLRASVPSGPPGSGGRSKVGFGAAACAANEPVVSAPTNLI